MSDSNVPIEADWVIEERLRKEMPVFLPGQIVYCQGRYRCRVLRQQGRTLEYVALEGFPSGYHGTPLHAHVGLFSHSSSP